MKKVLIILLCFHISCSKGTDTPNSIDPPDIPVNPVVPPVVVTKPVQMWVDAHANFSRFKDKSNIVTYLEKMKSVGFNEVYVDVKPGIGYALYNSDILPRLTKWGTETVTRDWDYLGVWIEEADKVGIKVIASISTLGYGVTNLKEGLIYSDHKWDGKTQMTMVGNDPTKIADMRDQEGVDAAMLNPVLPEVQQFVISIVEEIVTKYPKLKGVCLDYCRWWNTNYGFSDATIAAFEANSGLKLNSRNDIITATGGQGPQFKKWIEFRTATITNLVTSTRNKVKAVNPKMEFHLWAGADWEGRCQVGQNWASRKYKPTDSVYTDTYNETGFADVLDVFSMGAYTEHVWKTEYPGSIWTVENFVTRYSNFTMDDCKVNGSIASYAYGSKPTALSDAVYLCLKNTDGIMVFELSHVINFNQWDTLKSAIERVFKK
ncbi:MAG: family 10 glycosylhydrolase [Dysgonamonadaceae bacterium]|jgi:hypothetical protein|nr:family 10 glycosylhydrolase [Dysgonamonadaceae bacterium]